MMDFAVAIFLAVVATMVASVIFGKEDKEEGKRLEKWRVERVKAVLKDYRDTDKYVRKLEEEIRVPYREEDVNGDIKGTRSDSDLMFGTLWTIETDKQIRRLKRNKQIVQELLDECGSDTETIIRELYIKRFPQYTMQGLVDNLVIKCGRNKAFTLRDKFFEELDRSLDI